MRIPSILALIALGSLATAHAEDCVPTTSNPDIDLDLRPAARYYVEEECVLPCQVGPAKAIYLYEESNGIDGLQRADNHTDDTCGIIPGDTWIS